jgi:hypothetical protein
VGIRKLIKNLQKQLAKSEKKGKAPLDRIDDLLLEMAKKERKLEQQLSEEKNPTKRKHLKLEIKMARLQLKKGKKRRAELAAKRK